MEIMTSVISTVVVSIIIFVFRRVIGAIALELFLQVFSLPRNISGTWETTFWKSGKDETFTENAKVHQLLGRVWGIIEYKRDGQFRKYRMTGTIKENVLVATYEIISPRQPLDRGAFTLSLANDGNKLTGCYSWTDDDSNSPKGHDYVWTRLRDK